MIIHDRRFWVNILADAVKITLGPKGRNAVIEKKFGAPIITKDGVAEAKGEEKKAAAGGGMGGSY